MASPGKNPSPITTAVIGSVAAVVFLLTAGVAVGGSYLLSLSIIHKQAVTAEQLRAREGTAQIRTSIPICRALVEMDAASHIPSSNFPSPPKNGYDERLSAAISQFVKTSRCITLLADVAKHEPYTEILHQLGG